MSILPPGFPAASCTPHVKVCGITRLEDARAALDAGAAFLGFVFAHESPRCVTVRQACAILKSLRAEGRRPVAFGVFVEVSSSDAEAIAAQAGLAAIQLHGDHSTHRHLSVPVVPAFRMRGPELRPTIEEALTSGPVLLDAYHPTKAGGVGVPFDHDLATPFLGQGPVFIAGGLKPDTIGHTASAFARRGGQPYCYDISSGLESAPGIKDHDKIRTFFHELKQALKDASPA